MSQLEKDFLKAKLGQLPLEPFHLQQDEDEAEELDDLAELGLPLDASTSSKRYGDLTPLSGSDFFEEALSVHPPSSNTTFRVYYTPAKPKDDSNGILFVMHHGLGYSGLSFACVAKELSTLCHAECGFISLDCRGHGKTQGEDPYHLTLEQMSNDLVDVLREMLPDRTKAPKVVLVGHSMGGPVVVEAAPKIQANVTGVLGVAVLDIVEGTARDALHNMHTFLDNLPPGFSDIQQAITWFLRTRTVNNPESLRVSAPPLFLEGPPGSQHKLIWKTDLRQTEPYWNSWFDGLSKKFLGVKAAKLLVLAGTDRLDTDLIVGQMQGKFQLNIIPEAGHCLNEDTPKRLASILLDFWRRNDTTDILKHIKKVGQT